MSKTKLIQYFIIGLNFEKERRFKNLSAKDLLHYFSDVVNVSGTFKYQYQMSLSTYNLL